MPQSPSLGFELLTSNQDSKHVTVNASALILEAVSIGVVVDQLNTPPATPTNGQLYIVGVAGTGAFSGQNNKLALYDSTTWYFYSPKTNQTLYNTTLASYVRFGGTAWSSVSLGGSSSPTTTKGDLIVRNATTDVRQPVGTDGHILIADSTVANGLRWGAPAAATGVPNSNGFFELATTTYAAVSNTALSWTLFAGSGSDITLPTANSITCTPGYYMASLSLSLQSTTANNRGRVVLSNNTAGSNLIYGEQAFRLYAASTNYEITATFWFRITSTGTIGIAVNANNAGTINLTSTSTNAATSRVFIQRMG